MKKRTTWIALAGVVCIAASMTGCGGASGASISQPITTETDSLSAETENETESTTAVIFVTDADGQTVTQEDGTPVTTIITVPTVAPATTRIEAVTNDQGAAVTDDQGNGVTACVTSPPTKSTTTTREEKAATTARQEAPAEPTQPQPAPTAAPVPDTPEPTEAPTTPPTEKDAWKSPYDLNAIYADCKAEVERLGVRWDDSLQVDSSSWTFNDSTIAFSYYSNLSLKSRIFDEIHSEKNDHPTMKSCRVVFVPGKIDITQEYNCYILFTE